MITKHKYFWKVFRRLERCLNSITQVRLSSDTFLSDRNGDSRWKGNERRWYSPILPWAPLILGSVTVTIGFFELKKTFAEAKSNDVETGLNVAKRGDLPTYRLSEVKKHGKTAERIWITYKDGVYDVTDFIEGHPGGNKILLAAGGAADAFWDIYEQHKTPEVLEILEELRIGNLDPHDIVLVEAKDANDPYCNDPKRHPSLRINSQKPFNAETPNELIMDNFFTPNPLFFVRNHMPVPKVDAATHRLNITGIGVKRDVVLSLNDLKNNFNAVTVNSTIQCAGNRRAEMAKFKKVQGLSWAGTAISNAKWKGVRLKDVLIKAGVNVNDKRIKHVKLLGCDTDIEGNSYEASISFEKAMKDEVIIAYEMNGEEIPPDHGYPLRLIAPGIVGARQVKWLKKITLSDEESHSHWQRKDYRMLSPSIGATDYQDFESVPSIQEYPVQSAFCKPHASTSIRRDEGEIDVAGYAWSGGGRSIVRVEVSPDGGNTWQPAELEHDPTQDHDNMWSWTFFRASIKIPANVAHMDLVCKATDRAYNTQPETPKGIWNVRGLLNNAWHRVKVDIID